MNIITKVVVFCAVGAVMSTSALAAETSHEQAAAAASVKEQPVTIAYIEMSRIASDSKAGKAAKASLEAKSAKLRQKLDAKKKQLDKQKEEIQAKLPTLSPKEREAKAREFEKKVEAFQKLLRSSDQQMQEMQEELTKELYKKIVAAASVYAKSHGYSAVVEKKAVVYEADTLKTHDVTEALIEAIDRKGTK